MLRKYRKEDITAIVELERTHLDSSLEFSYYETDLDNPLAYHYVWEEKGKIIGFISTVFDGISLEILNFVVEQPYQSNGYGTKIFSTVLDELILKGLNQVTLEVKESNFRARSFYHKFGFKQIRVRENYYQNKENALVLQKLYDAKKDIVNLEAILFSEKDHLYFNTHTNEEALNHYDFYEDSMEVFNSLKEVSSIPVWTSQYYPLLISDYDYTTTTLLHANAYSCRINWCENVLASLTEIQCNLFSSDKLVQYVLFLNGKKIGSVDVLEYYHSLFITKLVVEPCHAIQEVMELLMKPVLEEAKKNNKVELYCKLETSDRYFKVFEGMQFRPVSEIYKWTSKK